MSWSISAVGHAGAVAKDVQRQFASIAKGSRLTGPEAEAFEQVRGAVSMLLDGFDPQAAVRVACAGSQMQIANPADPEDPKFTNDLKVDVSPIWGFLE